MTKRIQTKELTLGFLAREKHWTGLAAGARRKLYMLFRGNVIPSKKSVKLWRRFWYDRGATLVYRCLLCVFQKEHVASVHVAKQATCRTVAIRAPTNRPDSCSWPSYHWLFELCQSNLRISASSNRAVSFLTSRIFLHGYGSNLVNITLAGTWMCIPPNMAYCLIIGFDASAHIIYIFSISYALPFGKVQTIHVQVCSSHIKCTGASTCDVWRPTSRRVHFCDEFTVEIQHEIPS